MNATCGCQENHITVTHLGMDREDDPRTRAAAGAFHPADASTAVTFSHA
jgi:hypothetical protein